MNKPVTFNEIAKAAADLGLEPCAMMAVCVVESSGCGFWPSGRPKILFEGHVFWKELAKRGMEPEKLAEIYPSIIYP